MRVGKAAGVRSVGRLARSGPPLLVAFVVAVAVLALSLLAHDSASAAATLAVDTTADTIDVDPGDGLCEDAQDNCSLRAAIMEANALSGADTITLPAGTYLLTIPGLNEDAAATGDLDIVEDLTIVGAGATTTVVDARGGVEGDSLDRAFDIIGNVEVSLTVEISGVTVTGGRASWGGGVYNTSGDLTLTDSVVRGNTATSSSGGGIYNYRGTLALIGSTISGNVTEDDHGAGIYSNLSDVTLTDSVVRDNTADSHGGGIYQRRGTLTLTDSTISGNFAGAHAGGIFNDDGDVTLTDSYVVDNDAFAHGGGIENKRGALTLIRSTVSRNTSGVDKPDGSLANGGGVYNKDGDSLSIADSDISDNLATGEGGGIYSRGSGTVDVANSCIQRNDVEGVFIDFGSSAVTINGNNISGNVDGVVVYVGSPVDATGNWWGDPSGPSGIGAGSGDSASDGTNFGPWLTSPPDLPCAPAESVTLVLPPPPPPPPGMIILLAETDPAGAGGSFTFTGDLSGTTTPGVQLARVVLPGTYSSTEIVPAGMELTAISCSDADSTGDLASATATFNVTFIGEVVVCTFTNREIPAAEVLGSSMAISKTLVSADPAIVGGTVVFDVAVGFGGGAPVASVQVGDSYATADLAFLGATVSGTAVSCTVHSAQPDAAHDTVICDLGTMNGDFTIQYSFEALAPGVTLNEASVAVDVDGSGPQAPAVVGPVSAEAEIAAVLGIQLPDTGDGSMSAAAAGSGSLSPLALAAGALALGAALLAGVRTLALKGRDS